MRKMMPSWGYWALIASVGVALIIMLVTFFITRHKIHKIRDQYLTDEANGIAPSMAPEIRGENSGQLLWDLKEKTKNPLDDLLVEYSVNTIIRNNYQRIAVIGGSKYEEESFKQMANAKIENVDLDYILIMDKENLMDNFDAAYASLRIGGMISIAGFRRNNPQAKDLMAYLKITGIKFDYLKVSKGIILVVK